MKKDSVYTLKNGIWYRDGHKLNFIEKIYLHVGLMGLIKERELIERLKGKK